MRRRGLWGCHVTVAANFGLEEEGAFGEKPTILNKDEEDESELVTYMKGECEIGALTVNIYIPHLVIFGRSTNSDRANPLTFIDAQTAWNIILLV